MIARRVADAARRRDGMYDIGLSRADIDLVVRRISH